ncbi:WG repeat-containing protein [Aquimarina aquimarini]|uniref:WG repeat-containing protein n=1 Tax=Aquimarina aquimarini TaxID=1191734 RepID=UPI000D54CDCD|nr:WG repeat-containing protein [Aquimarina aquimarini]
MIKFKIVILTLLLFNLLKAQELKSFKVEVLVAQLPYANKKIKTKYENGKIYYVNTSDNTKIFLKGFEEAYPFFEKSAIVKENGKYGVIDRNGKFLVAPIHNTFKLAPYAHESYIVIFDDTNVFNLDRAEQSSYTSCEEPAPPELYAFKGKNSKYGIKKNEDIIIKPVYDSIFVVEDKFIIASKNKKIGVTNIKKEELVSFDYNNLQTSEDSEFDYTYPVFGLLKNNTWSYYKNGVKLIDSKFKCTSFLTLLDKSIGVLEDNDKKNILFEDGGTLDQNFDFISTNGLVAIKKNIVYLLNSDRSYEVYCKPKS